RLVVLRAIGLSLQASTLLGWSVAGSRKNRSRPCRRQSTSSSVKTARWRSASRNWRRISEPMPISGKSYSSSEEGINLGCVSHSARSPERKLLSYWQSPPGSHRLLNVVQKYARNADQPPRAPSKNPALAITER